VTLLRVQPGPLGYEIVGRYTGRAYSTQTDEVLARAVAGELTSHADIRESETAARQAACSHDEYIEITSLDAEHRQMLCMACSKELAVSQ
jgi:hypothetical protein